MHLIVDNQNIWIDWSRPYPLDSMGYYIGDWVKDITDES